MNILNLLSKEKRVAGIEISDSVVRIAFFRPLSKKRMSKPAEGVVTPEDELILIEEPIASNIIADGVVVDGELLGKTLRNIWTKAELGTEYAVVAIPDDKIYSRIFSFPKSVTEARVTEAMRLAIGFQLPMKTEDVYLDWERTIGTSGTNEIFLSTIPRAVVQGYISALEKAGIKTLALESHLSAIARSVKLTPETTTLFSKKTPDGATIFALKDGIMRFSRTLPLQFVPENKIAEETQKVKASLVADGDATVVEQDILEADIRDEYASRPEITKPASKWLVALGAAIRGKIPEGEDNLVSLLPIGTEEAYAYQRATTFIVLMRNLIIGVSIFFVVAYLATYLFMASLARETTEKITTLSATVLPPEVAAKEQQINDVNALTETGAMLLSQTPTWSPILAEIVARTPEGITISMFSAQSFTTRISLTGTAVSRSVLNNYKAGLQESPLLTEVELPLANLEQRENIPFSISFSLKDPGALYYK
ncbi:MAG: pilus assembly protein PilM [Candidatus Pacebacteria bacterium]|jgi:Tfp pilus assembly protein PilN|nr:pilus assembly protein PilM [Candidatus Paceibacterota bacterium]